MASWYGSRAIAGLAYLAAFRRRLAADRGMTPHGVRGLSRAQYPLSGPQGVRGDGKAPRILRKGPIPLLPFIEVLAAEQVKVQVKHRLPRLRAVADHDAECVFHAELARDLADREQQVAEQRLVLRLRVREPRDLLLGDDEDMDRRLRVDVLEGEAQLVLVDDVRRAARAR